MVTDGDLVAAILIALLILVILLCVWPGFLRLRGRDLAGYWASSSGAMYRLQPTGGRAFNVYADGPGRAPSATAGRITGVRGLRIGGRSGRAELGGRRISWAGGEAWTRQGVH
jgi:hypothetical protein